MSDNNKEKIFEAPIKAVNSHTEEIALKEYKLSWAGKIFFAGAAAYIMGKGTQAINLPIKIKGTPQQIQAITDAIVSSRRFQEEISKPGATVDSVIEKLRLRNLSKQQFETIVGLPWPL